VTKFPNATVGTDLQITERKTYISTFGIFYFTHFFHPVVFKITNINRTQSVCDSISPSPKALNPVDTHPVWSQWQIFSQPLGPVVQSRFTYWA